MAEELCIPKIIFKSRTKRFEKEIRNRIIIYTYGKRYMAWILPWIFDHILLVVINLIHK